VSADWGLLAILFVVFLAGVAVGLSVGLAQSWWNRKLRARLRLWQNLKSTQRKNKK
jgi:hypothetical protein